MINKNVCRLVATTFVLSGLGTATLGVMNGIDAYTANENATSATSTAHGLEHHGHSIDAQRWEAYASEQAYDTSAYVVAAAIEGLTVLGIAGSGIYLATSRNGERSAG